MNSINEAIHRTASEYTGGIRKLAKDLRLQPGTFSNKCNPSMESHILNIKELIDICLHTGNLSPLHEIARKLSCICVPIRSYTGVSDMELLDAWSEWDLELASTKEQIKKLLNSKQITAKHIDRIEKEMYQDFQKELALLERLKNLSS